MSRSELNKYRSVEKLVKMIANDFYLQYSGYGLTESDFQSECNLAFINCLDTFDEKSNTRFSTYFYTACMMYCTNLARKKIHETNLWKKFEKTGEYQNWKSMVANHNDYNEGDVLSELNALIKEVEMKSKKFSDTQKKCLRCIANGHTRNEMTFMFGQKYNTISVAINSARDIIKTVMFE